MSDNNKNELKKSAVDNLFEELEQAYRLIAQTDQAPIAKLGLYATSSMQYLRSDQKLFTELRNTVFNISGSHISIDTWYSRTVDLFAGTLDEAIRARKIRAINSHKVGALFLDSIIGLTVHQIDSERSAEIEDDVRDLMDLYLNGLIVKS